MLFFWKSVFKWKIYFLACLKKIHHNQELGMPGKPAHPALFLVSSGKEDNKELDNMESWNLKPGAYPALVLCGLAAETTQDFLKTTCLLQLHVVQSA